MCKFYGDMVGEAYVLRIDRWEVTIPIYPMRILFVYPNILRFPLVPIGLSSLMASLREEGKECSLFDATFIDDENLVDKFLESVENSSCDLLAIHCTSSDLKLVQILLVALEKSSLKKHTLTVIGGHHPTAAPEEVIASPLIDILVIGEGELAMKELCQKLEERNDIRYVKKCWVKLRGEIFRNKSRPLIQNLDSLSYPTWEVFDERHISRYGRAFQKSSREITTETSRGCPYSCAYCMNSYLSNIYKGLGRFCREKSADRVIAEAKHAKERLGAAFIHVIDDNFVGSIERLKELSFRFPKEVGVPLAILTSADKINKKTIILLTEMEVLCIGMGIETGNEIYRREILRKHVSNEQIVKAFKLARKHGIITTAYYMIGLPLEKRRIIEQAIKFNELIQPNISVVSTFFPFPGTLLHDAVIEKGLVQHYDYFPDFYHESVLEFEDLTSADLENYKRQFLNVVLDTAPLGRRDLKKVQARGTRQL